MVINWAAVSAGIAATSLLCSGALFVFGTMVVNKIQNNDLFHVQEALDRIEKDFKDHREDTENQTRELIKKVAHIEGRCQARHKSED